MTQTAPVHVGKGKSVVVEEPTKKKKKHKPIDEEMTIEAEWLEEMPEEEIQALEEVRRKRKEVFGGEGEASKRKRARETQDIVGVPKSGSSSLITRAISQASTAPTGFVHRLTIGTEERFNVDSKKKVVEDSKKWLRDSDQYYSFGRNMQFEIPVENIIEPHATMCYRKMNRQHVENLMKEMIANPGITPQVAEVIACNPLDNTPLTFTYDQQADFIAAIPVLKFCAVSGQHSAQAVNNLIKRSKEVGGHHLEKIVEPLLV